MFVDQKYPLLDKYKIVEIFVGYPRIPSFLVSQTDFPPHPSQDNQLGNSMVFILVGVILSDGEGGVKEAAEDRAFRTNANPLIL